MCIPTFLALWTFVHKGILKMWCLPIAALLLSVLPVAFSACYDPEPAFPLPTWRANSSALIKAFRALDATVQEAISSPSYNTTFLSIEVTSSDETLWSFHHTAAERNVSRPGTPKVSGDSVYRIASITKTFTVLGLLKQHVAGNLSLDDSIQEYLEELRGPQNGSIPWKDITLRSLASQLSGIPREYAFFDLGHEVEDGTRFGLPPLSSEDMPPCTFDGTTGRKCTRQDYLNGIKQMRPVFAPNQKSSYSNMAFILLGLALENITGMAYTDYMRAAIFEPLGMNHTSFEKPDDTVAVLPVGGATFWDADLGISKPTGGIYTSSSDLSKFLRYILTHYNGITPALNWLNPVSYSGGIASFYGMPWEIFRTASILPYTNRPTTFVTKGGALPAYVSMIFLIPEYNIGMTALVAGNMSALSELRELVTGQLVRALDEIVQEDIHKKYPGKYVGSVKNHLDSSLTIDHTPHAGLFVKEWISNGTDVVSSILEKLRDPTVGGGWRAQLVPTLLYQNETAQEGELWRIEVVAERPESGDSATRIWDESCLTNIDGFAYGGKPLFEIVFFEDSHGRMESVGLTGFRQMLRRTEVQQAPLLTQA